jgi:hypothetical protein
MKISKWLDKKVSEGVDVSHIKLPEEMLNDEAPEETIFFEEIRPCSILCPGDHAFTTVERFGNWYYVRGRDKEDGPHTTQPPWWLFTKDEALALQTAKEHIGKG